MAGVWYFKDGVIRCVADPFNVTSRADEPCATIARRHRKILVHCPSNEIMTNFEQLDEKLLGLGWHPFHDGGDGGAGDSSSSSKAQQPRRQYHLCACSADLLTLPAKFNGLRTTHMYDIVVKTHSTFQVRDVT